MAKIENLEVSAQNPARHLIVELAVGIMTFLEQAPDRDADVFEVGFREQGRRRDTDQRNRRDRSRKTKP